MRKAKDLAKNKVFTHPRKIELEIGAYSAIATILSILCPAALEYLNSDSNISSRSNRVLDLIGRNTFNPNIIDLYKVNKGRAKYLVLMRVIDFVSGMTDHYATFLAKQFNGMGEIR